MRATWTKMKSLISGIEFPLTLSALIFLLLKASVSTVTWPETVGIALILVVHYARTFAPARKKSSINPADLEKAMSDIAMIKAELGKVKLAVGFRTIRNPERVNNE